MRRITNKLRINIISSNSKLFRQRKVLHMVWASLAIWHSLLRLLALMRCCNLAACSSSWLNNSLLAHTINGCNQKHILISKLHSILVLLQVLVQTWVAPRLTVVSTWASNNSNNLAVAVALLVDCRCLVHYCQ